MSEPELLAAARRLAAVLGPERSVLVGGLCANVLGIARLTHDVDMGCVLEPDAALALLAEAGVAAVIRRGGPSDPLPWAISGRVDGVPFHVLPAAVVGDPGAGVYLPELGLAVLTAAGFIAAKCRAGAWKDLYDVAWLCLKHPALEAYALATADAHGVADRLRTVLQDERLRAQVDDR